MKKLSKYEELCHEVFNPLFIILGKASLLERSLKDEKSVKRCSDIVAQVKRIEEYIRSINPEYKQMLD